MKKLAFVCGLLFLLGVIFSAPIAYADVPNSPILLAQASTDDSADEEDEDEYEDDDEYDEYDDEDVVLIPDPFMEFNYGIWVFNDRLYFWVLKPVAQVYGFVIPEEIRMSPGNPLCLVRARCRVLPRMHQRLKNTGMKCRFRTCS